MKNIRILRKSIVILAFSVCSMVSAFAQGAVIAYADGKTWIEIKNQYTNTTFPSTAQLQRLTHVIASDIGVKTHDVTGAYEGLWINQLPNNWSGGTPSGTVWKRNNHSSNKNSWLLSLVNRAHAAGIKAILCVGGGADSHVHWVNATSTNNDLINFVNDIVSFVNLHGFDGVDIDWEYPGRNTNDTVQKTIQWNQCINLLNALKAALPGKRISIALAGYPSNSRYPNTSILAQIWNAVHAIHLMTYDNSDWQTHSRANNSISVINSWANLATPSNNLDIKKLHLSCAFYGYTSGGNNSPLVEPKVPYATYLGGGNNPGDLVVDVQRKVDSCYNRGYGGVFVWELGYDKILPNNTPELLEAIRIANTFISGSDIVCYNGNSFTLVNPPSSAVHWTFTNGAPFSFSPSNSQTSATGNSVHLFKYGSETGTFTLFARNQFNELIASKTVSTCPTPYISGNDNACSGSSVFNLIDAPQDGTINWSLSNSANFSISPSTGESITLSRFGSNNAYASTMLYAHSSNQSGNMGAIVAQKFIPACEPLYISGPDIVCYLEETFTIHNANGPITWHVDTPFEITSASGNSVTVKYTKSDINSGTLYAKYFGNTIASKTITCERVDVTAFLSLKTNLPNNPYITATFLAETTFPGQIWSSCQEILTVGSNDSAYVFVAVKDDGYGYFTECDILINTLPNNFLVSYYVKVEVTKHTWQDESIHTQEIWGETYSAYDYIGGLLGSGWGTSINSEEHYTMDVHCVLRPLGHNWGRSFGTGFEIEEEFELSLDKSLSSQSFQESDIEVTIYPNPTFGMVRVDIDGVDIPRGAMIEVYSPGGAPVRRLTGISTSNTFDISRHPPGVYTMRIILDAENVSVWKIMKN